MAEFAQDQHGSRFIQQKLETVRQAACARAAPVRTRLLTPARPQAPPEDIAALFEEMMPSVNKLMTDVFGRVRASWCGSASAQATHAWRMRMSAVSPRSNYVIQCFLSHGSEEQRGELVKQLSGRVLPLALQMYGCRVIQKALEVLDVEGKRALVDELEGHVLTCVHDQNGNHVVQKAIEFCPPELRQRFMTAFAGATLRLAQHPYGCRVVQARGRTHTRGVARVRVARMSR